MHFIFSSTEIEVASVPRKLKQVYRAKSSGRRLLQYARDQAEVQISSAWAHRGCEEQIEGAHENVSLRLHLSRFHFWLRYIIYSLVLEAECTLFCTGNTIPTLFDITIQVSMASRVGCVGENGAGKSTMIKVLTGEVVPQTGDVWKHPNARVAYVAQHAFHHIESHLRWERI